MFKPQSRISCILIECSLVITSLGYHLEKGQATAGLPFARQFSLLKLAMVGSNESSGNHDLQSVSCACCVVDPVDSDFQLIAWRLSHNTTYARLRRSTRMVRHAMVWAVVAYSIDFEDKIVGSYACNVEFAFLVHHRHQHPWPIVPAHADTWEITARKVNVDRQC